MDERSSTLTLARRHLVQLMRQVGHGRVEGFPIVNGEPVLIPPPRVVYELRVPAGAKAPGPASEKSALKAAIIELFQLFTRLGNASVAWLEVRDGLPVRVAVEPLDDHLESGSLRGRHDHRA